MSISKLPSGRYRAQVYDPELGRNRSVGTFDTKREAKAAREAARGTLAAGAGPTLQEWWDTWTTDPLYARPKESTNLHYRDCTRAFVKQHGKLPLTGIDDMLVARWLAGGKRNWTVPSLRVMFSDAASAKAGRLVADNPFAGLGISKGKGNAQKQPPSEAVVWELIQHARDLTMPAWAAWLQVAAFTGLRPAELDALRWENVDMDTGTIHVVEQWTPRGRFTLPKNGLTRDAILTPPAREALIALPRESEFCFTTIRGTHFTPSSRLYHWNTTRAAGGWRESLYLATRHFTGWYMINVLLLPSEDVAIALGHTDGGELVRKLYGHRDKDLALDRVRKAYEQHGRVTPLRVIRKDTA